jgi:imidazolonepropionase-like amidohydrolase
MIRGALVLLLVLAAAAARAADLAWAAADDARPLAFVNATVHVGDGRTVLQGATVVVEGGRIAGVGVSPPAGARVADVAGMHLTPGLFAADTVLGLVEIGAVRATRDETEVGRANPHVRASVAVNPDSELLPVAMAGGVLHALVAPRGGLVSGTSAVMLLSGWTREDMALRDPAALHVDWPEMRLRRGKDAKPPVEEQEKALRAALDELDDLFADARTYLAAAPARARREVPRRDHDPRLEAMAPVLSGEIPVVVSANTVQQVRAAIAWAREQGVRLVISGAREGWRVAAELAAAKVPVVVHPVRALPAHDFDPYDAAFANPVALCEAGVTVCFTAGAESFSAPHARNLPDEAAMAVAFGMPAEEALRAITLSPAEVFGVADRVGSVATGKRADLVVWDGPPLEITSRAVHLVLGGKVLPHDDRHERLYQKYRARPRRAAGPETAPAAAIAPGRAPASLR